MKLIELNLHRIFDLCRQHKVKTLSVFGSILTDKFNDDSDVDLLVDFELVDYDKFDYVRNYFDFREALERLFNRRVDLIEEKGLRNKYFIANVNRTKQMIYGTLWRSIDLPSGCVGCYKIYLWSLVIRHIPELKVDIERLISSYENIYKHENNGWCCFPGLR